MKNIILANKELNEWCGTEDINYYEGIEALGFLFKYAVPKALEAIAERGYCPPVMKLFQLWYDELVTQTGDSSNIEQAALALFWTVKFIKEGGVNNG